MSCYSHDTFADRLDGLLTKDEKAAFDSHVETCKLCAFTLSQETARHALIQEPYAVPEPAQDLRARIQADHARREPSRLGRVLRYAASFAAGVVVTMAVDALTSASEAPDAPHSQTGARASETDDSLPAVPRRIH